LKSPITKEGTRPHLSTVTVITELSRVNPTISALILSAVVGTRVEIICISIVTLFQGIQYSITAIELTIIVTQVKVVGISVIALLQTIIVDDSVTTFFDLATRRATIPAGGIAVVTLLSRF